MAIYMKYVGKKSGSISGDVDTKSYKNWIRVTSIEFGYHRPTSGGHATGKSVIRQINLTKHMDKASVMLAGSGMNNESGEATIHYVMEGGAHKKFAELVVSDTVVADFDSLAFEEGSTVEKLSLTFTKLEYTWVDGGITTVLDTKE